jgi:hypothetical protein
MPFLKLDNSWSNLAKYYNQSFNNKPEVPTLKYTAFDDGLIRGGVINATLASVRDTARIGKFFASGKGVLFITKQVGLQLSNPLLEQEAPKDAFGKLGTNTTSNLLNKAAGAINTATNAINSFLNKRTPNQIYNLGLNTLTQIPLVSAGGHIIRQGTLPVGGGGYLNNDSSNVKGYSYEKIARENNLLSKVTINSVTKTDNSSNKKLNNNLPSTNSPILTAINNAKTGNYFSTTGDILLYSSPDDEKAGNITKLAEQKTLGEVLITKGKNPSSLTYQNLPNRLLQHLTSTLIDNGKITNKKLSPTILLEYNGGPGSTYGIGKTIISTNKDQRTNATNTLDDPKRDVLNGFDPTPYAVLDGLSQALSSEIQRKRQTYITPSLTDDNIENRVGVSKINKEINTDQRSVDAINTISIMNSKTFYDTSRSAKALNTDNSTLFTYSNGTEGKVQAGNFGRDIIKFRIEFLDNDTNTPTILAFRAYIDDFQDGMQAKWSTYRYMGRGEDFYVYDGFSRDMSIAFTIYAHSPEEMKPLYQKLNYLMSAFTPDYNSANKMRGNIGYLTVGDYVNQQPGIFTDIKLSGMLDTHWEIAMDDPEDGSSAGQYELPKHIKVNLTFKPIHNFLPRRTTAYTLDKSPFITPNSALIGKEVKNKYLYNPAPSS